MHLIASQVKTTSRSSSKSANHTIIPINQKIQVHHARNTSLSVRDITSTHVLQLISSRRLLPLAFALPQGGFKDPDPEVPDFGDTPGKYCLCLRPVDGRQDPEPTAQVCPQFASYGAFATEIEFGGPGGGYFGAVRIICFLLCRERRLMLLSAHKSDSTSRNSSPPHVLRCMVPREMMVRRVRSVVLRIISMSRTAVWTIRRHQSDKLRTPVGMLGSRTCTVQRNAEGIAAQLW